MSAFEKMMAGAKEIEAHLKGDIDLETVDVEVPDVDVAAIRKSTGQSQREFSDTTMIPLGTLRNWEQGRRALDPASRALFTILKHNPAALSQALDAERSAAR